MIHQKVNQLKFKKILKIEFKKIHKNFLNNKRHSKGLNFSIRSGNIYALIGKNGAGKSTAMAILSGNMQLDSGSILINDYPVIFKSPLDALKNGIGIVHQELKLFQSMTVVENIVFNKEPKKFFKIGIFNRKQAIKKVKILSKRYNLHVNPNIKIKNLNLCQRQKVEILKILYRKLKIIILDEPTAILNEEEIKSLFKILISLKKIGCIIVFITHKIKEILNYSDAIIVVDNGETIACLDTKETNKKKLENYLSNNRCKKYFSNYESKLIEKAKSNKVILNVKNLVSFDKYNHLLIKKINFFVKEGEIVGIAGLPDSGKTQLIKTIFGFLDIKYGSIYLYKKSINKLTIKERRIHGLAYVPEDRQIGISLRASIQDNILAGFYKNVSFLKKRAKNKNLESKIYSLINKFNIKINSTKDLATTLSGGNLQKIIIGREINIMQSSCLLIENPTRGLDLISKKIIYKQLLHYKHKKRGMLLTSHELDELCILSDRILVMSKGKIVSEFKKTISNPFFDKKEINHTVHKS